MWMKLAIVLSILGLGVFAIDYPKDTCGLRPLASGDDDDPSKIVGGAVSKRGDWPWKISMHRNGNHICGGSLINDEWIITAAHCVVGTTPASAYRIIFGLHDQLSQDQWVITRGVANITIHKQYNSRNISHDIALMKLSEKIETYTEYYMPVCFPRDDQTFDNQLGITVGWGAQVYGGRPTRYLNEVATPILTDSACEQRYGKDMVNTTLQICSGGDNKGACQGDSGGPIVVADPTRNGRYVLVGLTSWGYGCGQGGVYTRVSAYKAWVESFAGSVVS